MKEINFDIKGSSTQPYRVTFIKDEGSLTAICNCPAGQFGNFCKHRIAILNGEFNAICSDNPNDAETVLEWLVDTDVERALTELRAAESAEDVTKKRLQELKKKLARAMNS